MIPARTRRDLHDPLNKRSHGPPSEAELMTRAKKAPRPTEAPDPVTAAMCDPSFWPLHQEPCTLSGSHAC
jgi:hypothetical protein